MPTMNLEIAKLKKKYLVLKAVLNVAGVNLTDINEIKE